jgi:hypothetical protein
VLELVLVGIGVRDVGDDRAIHRVDQVVVDLELAAAQRRQIRGHDRSIGLPDLDPEDLARPDQVLELVVDRGRLVLRQPRQAGAADHRVDEPGDDGLRGRDCFVDRGLREVVRDRRRDAERRCHHEDRAHEEDPGAEAGAEVGREGGASHGCSPRRWQARTSRTLRGAGAHS